MNGRRHVGFYFLALVLASAAPARAAEKDGDCVVLKALANADGRRFSDLRLSVDADSGLMIAVGRTKSDLTAPYSCDLDYNESDIDLSCQWHFNEYAAALAYFDPLLEKARRCLPASLPQTETMPTSTGWNVLRRHEGDIEGREGETHFEISLVEYSREADQYLSAETVWIVSLQTEFSLD